MKYGSVCSGIEAATQAWHPLGWEPAWFSEIEKFPSAVLAHHHPNVPNLGDMTSIRGGKQILRRAGRRGKKLPQALQVALEAGASEVTPS